MTRTPLTKPGLRIMEVLWTRGACSIREIHEALPAKGRAAFTTVQTVVYRLEKKHTLRCVKRISHASVKFLIPLSSLVTLGRQMEWRTPPAVAQLAGSFLMEEILAPEALTIAARVPQSQPLSAVPWLIVAV